jgi:hypothetical protein
MDLVVTMCSPSMQRIYRVQSYGLSGLLICLAHCNQMWKSLCDVFVFLLYRQETLHTPRCMTSYIESMMPHASCVLHHLGMLQNLIPLIS